MFVLLRTEPREARKMSQMLYQSQDELEIECQLSCLESYQAFVFGDGVVTAREFACYPNGFRCQCQQQIKEYSAGEALIIASDMMREAMWEHSGDGYRMYILVDGSLKNDRLFQNSLSMLKERKKEGMEIRMISGEGDSCEACHHLYQLAGKEERTYAFKSNSQFS